jgi:hypothetical protein
MNSVISLLTENIHLARRLGSGGIILTAIFLIMTQQEAELQSATPGAIELLKSPGLLFYLVLLTYFLGVISEVIGELILARLSGAVVWGFLFPTRQFRGYPKITQFVCRAFLFLFSGFAVYLYFFRALVGKEDFVFNYRKLLSPAATKHMENLRGSAQAGFHKPFGPHNAHAWQEIKIKLSQKNSEWLDRIHGRTSDVLSFMTSIFICLFALLLSEGGIEEFSEKLSGYASFLTDSDLAAMLLITTYLFLGFSFIYLASIKRTTVSALEIYASEQSGGEEHQLSKPVESKITSSYIFQNLLFMFLLFGNLINIIYWNFTYEEYPTDDIASLFMFGSAEAGLLSGNVFQLASLFWVSGVFLIAAIILTNYLPNGSIKSRGSYRWLLAVVFVGCFGGALIFESINWVSSIYLEDEYLEDYIWPLDFTLRFAGVIVAFLLVFHFVFKQKITNRIGSVLVSVLIIAGCQYFAEWLGQFPDLGDFNIGLSLVYTMKWASIAIVLSLGELGNRNGVNAVLKQVGLFALVLFGIHMLFSGNWQVYEMLNYSEDGLSLEFGTWVTWALPFAALWQFSEPLQKFVKEFDTHYEESKD